MKEKILEMSNMELQDFLEDSLGKRDLVTAMFSYNTGCRKSFIAEFNSLAEDDEQYVKGDLMEWFFECWTVCNAFEFFVDHYGNVRDYMLDIVWDFDLYELIEETDRGEG